MGSQRRSFRGLVRPLSKHPGKWFLIEDSVPQERWDAVRNTYRMAAQRWGIVTRCTAKGGPGRIYASWPEGLEPPVFDKEPEPWVGKLRRLGSRQQALMLANDDPVIAKLREHPGRWALVWRETFTDSYSRGRAHDRASVKVQYFERHAITATRRIDARKGTVSVYASAKAE